MIKLYDKTGETLIGNLDDCISCKVEEGRNGIFEARLIYPAMRTISNDFVKENIIVCKANDILLNQKFRIYNIRKKHSNTIEIFARHISFDLLYDFIEGISIVNQSCEYALNTIFRNSQFSRHYKGYSDIINAQDYNISMTNCLSAIAGKEGSIIDTFGNGAEILRNNENIHVLNRRGHDNGVTIEYGKNLDGFECIEDTTDLVTRIFPFVKRSTPEGDITITLNEKFVDSPRINNYSHPYIRDIDLTSKFGGEEEVTQAKLKLETEKYFIETKCDIPKFTFRVKFIPLSKCIGFENISDQLSLCDIATIKHKVYGITTQSKVIKTVFDVLKDRYESMELGDPKVSLGDLIGNGDAPQVGPPGPQGPPGQDGSIGDFPDSLPAIPQLSASILGFASVDLSWTYENKVYYNYQVFASKTENFEPNVFDLIFEGQASSFLHQVKPNETWYYRARAVNTHGKATELSTQVKVTTKKVDDFENYFSSVAIENLVAGIFTVDYMKAGIVKGNWIDAKNLSVTDGNGKRTLDIDSSGNVSLDVARLSIKSKDVEKELGEKATKAELSTKSNEILAKVSKETDANNVLANGAFEDGLNGYEGWKADLSVNSGVLTINALDTATDYGFITPRFNLEDGNFYTLSFDANSYYNTLKLNYCYLMDTQYGNIRLDSNIQLDPQGYTTRVKLTFKTADKYRNVRLLIGYEGTIDNTTGFRVANLMIAKGEYVRDYTPKAASFTEVEMRFRPDSIVQNINQGLNQGSKIAVAGTVLDKNGFSQLNNGKLSVRLNNNGTHIYSILNEGKINGSIQALRQTRTNDDIMAMTHESNSFLAIDYPKPNEPGTYWDYVIFDIYKLINPIPITFSTDTDFSGYNIWLNKRSADVGSRIFGGKRDEGRGYAALHGTNLQFVDPSSGNFHFNVTREMFDVYSSEIQVRNSLKVYGNKNCIQETKYGDIPFYANEDINSLLTETNVDIIFETTLVDGKYICRIEIDELMQECINTTIPYNVYIDKVSFGDYKVEIREADYFIVESDRPLKFKYKLEGRRKGFEIESKEVNFMKRMTVKLPKIDSIPDKPSEIVEKPILYKPSIEMTKY